MQQNSLVEKKRKVDMVFLLDATASMKPCIDALKDNISSFIETLVNPAGNEGIVIEDWRIKICGYRDVKADGDQWWVDTDFSSEIDEVKSNLGSLQANGGGDEPESLLDAIWKVANFKEAEKGGQYDSSTWRSKSEAAHVLVFFTDAQSHMEFSIPEAEGAQIEDLDNKVNERKMFIFGYGPEADCYHTLNMFENVELEFVGSLDDAREKMKEYTSNKENFSKVLLQLAQSISASAAIE